ncbi:hypothetical protein [Demetria terragena]|uniref:hypothetical protein n=1 Tax=Demetria terragena TaxID=63959 RepID=UPI000379FAAF|nr:hypothetical protein [Demetria terragena]
MRGVKVLALVASASIGVAGLAAPSAMAAPSSQSVVSASTADDAKLKKLYDKLVALMPADAKARQQAARAKVDIHLSPQQEAALGLMERMSKDRAALKSKGASRTAIEAIDPTDYDCGPTKLQAQVQGLLTGVNQWTMLSLTFSRILEYATYDALYYATPKDADYDLRTSAGPLNTSFEQSKRFWDVPLNDVKLFGMKKNIFADLNRLTQAVQATLGVGPADAAEIAKVTQATIQADPALNGGDHPIFTLGAFAFSGEGEADPTLRRISDRVIVGEGMLSVLVGSGNGRVGPQAVVAHEMAHHVQYEIGSFDSPDKGTAEGTRRTELMADGFASYFGAHKKGMNATPSKVLEFQRTFHLVGDCSFTSGGHHGTPNQRRAASAWGAATAAYAKDPNRIKSAKATETAFTKVLPELVAPDAPVTAKAYRSKVAP